jgi:hypothetical protein
MSETRLTSEEIQTVTQLLAKLEPGFLPFEIFHAITRLVATPIIEVVPLRHNTDGGVDILLLRRDNNDPVWPNKLHIPGTVVRASDSNKNFDEAFERILSGELNGVTADRPTFVKNLIHHSGRGMEVSQIYWIEIVGQPSTGQFYNVKELPADLVESQMDFIPAAIQHFNDTEKHA